MTGEPDLTPEQEESVSRLLAELGGPEPTPPRVADRLDERLSALVAERAAVRSVDSSDPRSDAPDAEVASLTARKGRRRWTTALLAAAAVVVGGYGVGAVLTQGSLSGDDADSASTADAQAEIEGGEVDATPLRAPESGGRAAAKSAVRDLAGFVAVGEPPRLSSDRLDDDVRRVLALAERPTPSPLAPRATTSALGCPPPRVPAEARWFQVRYDGARAALVAGPEQDGEVTATVYACSGARLAGTTVEVR